MREAINSDKGKAGGKKANEHQKRLRVSMKPVATPDAKKNLSRAIDILLRAAGRDTSQSSKESTKV